jgi:geranylgeranyl reductase family protein
MRQDDSTAHDLIVIGGGPSGSSAARVAAKAGLSVLLLEKSPMPRRKVCGGGVSAQALGYLDFEVPARLVDHECYGARITFGGRMVEARLPERVGILSARAKFDLFLLQQAQAAGARVLHEVVKEIRPNGEQVVVVAAGGEHRARVAIIAAGAGNRLTEAVRRRDDDHEYAVTLEAEIPVEEPDRFRPLTDMIEIAFGVTRFGYGWVFHHRDHYSVGVGGLRSQVGNPHGPMRGYLEDHGFSLQPAGMRGHPIPLGGLRRRIVSGRLLLAGDAAGFVDPFAGEGIAYAIRSGQLAAEAVCAAAAKGWQLEELRTYERRAWRELGRDLRWSLWMSKLVYSYPRAFLGLFVRSRRLAEKYLEVPLHKLTYARFVRWMVPRLPLLWFQAWRESAGHLSAAPRTSPQS